MRTEFFLKHLTLGALLIATVKLVGQSSTPGNVASGSTDFLGWNTNAANSFPLMVRHDLNQPIEWYTDAVRRMQLTPYRTATINGFSVQQHAYLGISRQPNAFNFPTTEAPYSRIHLIDSSRWSIAW